MPGFSRPRRSTAHRAQAPASPKHLLHRQHPTSSGVHPTSRRRGALRRLHRERPSDRPTGRDRACVPSARSDTRATDVALAVTTPARTQPAPPPTPTRPVATIGRRRSATRNFTRRCARGVGAPGPSQRHIPAQRGCRRQRVAGSCWHAAAPSSPPTRVGRHDTAAASCIARESAVRCLGGLWCFCPLTDRECVRRYRACMQGNLR